MANDPYGLTLYTNEVMYDHYLREGIPYPFTRMVKVGPVPMMDEIAQAEADLQAAGATFAGAPPLRDILRQVEGK